MKSNFMKNTNHRLKSAVMSMFWIGVGVCLWGLASYALDSNHTVPEMKVDTTPIERSLSPLTSYAPMLENVTPSVVNIFTTKNIQAPLGGNPLGEDPILRYFFGPGQNPFGGGNGAPRSRQQQGLGSGVIISSNGFILTNNHVIEGADEIVVAIEKDGQTNEYKAEVIGSDARTDVGVLKIDATDLPALTLADSEDLRVGDITFAVGNPFGVGKTVTSGIISALGRGALGIVDYENFIQTDASINPGNSGGALVDIQGRLIGINTAIISGSGGAQGVGFAVPINLARSIMERLIEDGSVRRGYLGVLIQPISQDLAEAFKIEDRSGALVGGLTPGGPAEKAGIEPGDIILKIDGTQVKSDQDLRLIVAQRRPGSSLKVTALRDGKKQDFEVVLDEFPEDPAMASYGGEGRGQRDDLFPKDSPMEGVQVMDSGSAPEEFRVPEDLKGALVVGIDSNAIAAQSGLRVGDVILEINRERVKSGREAVEAARGLEGRALLRVWSQGGTRFLVVGGRGPRR